MATLEQRVADLEARLGPAPMAVPPMTIGELTNVPVPGSAIAAAWSQDISSRVVQRFPTTAALKAWSAPAGAVAVALDTGIMWRRHGTLWSQVTPWIRSGTPAANSGATVGSFHVNTLVIPADPAIRTALVICWLELEKTPASPQVQVRIDAGGVQYSQSEIDAEQNINAGGAPWRKYRVSMVATFDIAANVSVSATTTLVIGAAFTVQHDGSSPHNRLSAIVAPKG